MLAYFDGSHTDIVDVAMAEDVALAADGLSLDMPELDLLPSDAANLGSVFTGREPHDFDGSDFDRSNIATGASGKAWTLHPDTLREDTERRLQRDRRRERLTAFEIGARTAHLFRHATRG